MSEFSLTPNSLNGINSGPSGGKSTLVAQAAHARIYNQPFWIPELTLPPGRVAWVQTDRERAKYLPLFVPLGLHDHPNLHTENFVEDEKLHFLSRPCEKKLIPRKIDNLQNEIGSRLKDKDIGTVILDLYDPFHAGSTNDEASYYSRHNARWAKQMGVCILAIVYPFKQTTARSALRTQDRMGGFLQVQASMDYKITIIDNEELTAPYWSIQVVPPPGMGKKRTELAIRGTEEEGDPVGLFRKYEGQELPSLGDIMIQWNCHETKAYAIRKRLASGESPEYIDGGPSL